MPSPSLKSKKLQQGNLPKNNASELFASSENAPDKELQALIDRFIVLRKQRIAAEKVADDISAKEDQLEDTLCTAMVSRKLKSIKRTSGVMVIAGQKHEFFIKPESKELFFKHLKTSGDEGLITTTVNYQTLQGHMNRLLESGAEKKVLGLKKFLEERTRNQLTVRGLK